MTGSAVVMVLVGAQAVALVWLLIETRRPLELPRPPYPCEPAPNDEEPKA